jgi:hypothetical protein
MISFVGRTPAREVRQANYTIKAARAQHESERARAGLASGGFFINMPAPHFTLETAGGGRWP